MDYFHQDAEKNELLRTCDELKDHRVEIAAFFADHPDNKERGNFLKQYFSNTYVEKILTTGQRVGYRAYDDLLLMWRGAYLSREREVFSPWWNVASRISGMIMMDLWLDSDEKPLPTEEEQKQLILRAEAKDGIGFTLPQAAIDHILCGGNHVQHGKLRIYEFFSQGKTAAENIATLKDVYGIGGHSDAIPGSGLWEDHDGKGIRISRYSSATPERNAETLLKWPVVERRIRELIAADRYLSPAEKEAYPKYVRDKALRMARHEIVEEYRSIVYDYNDFWTQIGDKDKCLYVYPIGQCWSAFSMGERTTRTEDGDIFILPRLREVMQQIIDADTHHADRARAMLEKLKGELALPFEPTYDELNPPPPPPKEYRLSLGDALYVGAQQYELLSLGDDEVTLFDPSFPLFHKVYPTAEFYDLLKENPLNDKYLQVVEAAVEDQPLQAPVDMEAALRMEAEQLVHEFTLDEFGVGIDDYRGADMLPLATATTEGDLHEITVYANLEEHSIDTEMDHILVKRDQYGSLAELIEKRLRHLNLKELTAVDMSTVPMVGRIDYLGNDGKVAYSTEYMDEASFVADIKDNLDSGVPITLTFYRNADGKAISRDFIFEQGAMPKGMDVVDNPYLPRTGITAHELFEQATQLIDRYCEHEFGSPGDYDDLRNIPIGHTTITDDEIPIQLNLNLIDFCLDRYIEGILVERRKYDSLEDLIKNELEELSFDALIDFTDEQLARVAIHGTTPEHAATFVSDNEQIEVMRYPNGYFYNHYGYDPANGTWASVAGGFDSLEEAEQALLSHRPQAHRENRTPTPYVDHFYVVEDIQKRGALDITEYATVEDALAAYQALPATQMKALGLSLIHI